MTTQYYPKGKAHIFGLATKVDLVADNIIAILLHSASTPFNSTHEFIADLSGTGIIARSGNLAGKTVTDGVFDANDVTFTSVTGASVDAFIIAKDTGSDATSVLIAWFDLAIPRTPDGTNMTMTWNPLGIFAF